MATFNFTESIPGILASVFQQFGILFKVNEKVFGTASVGTLSFFISNRFISN